jgi:transcriptional regulator GlxA family with amidase domain
MSQQAQVGILVFPDVEVLDFCGPFEAFSATSPVDDDSDEAHLYGVHVIAESTAVISCRNGLLVQPHFALDDHPSLDLIVVPGGRGTRQAQSSPAIRDWIVRQAASVQFTTSVCTGAFLLAAAGLLDGKAATTHWGSISRLRDDYPTIAVREDVRFVDQGAIVTSAGVSAGLDMSLHVIERMHGRDVAAKTARYMEYDWRP